jgi:hypothetical protein
LTIASIAARTTVFDSCGAETRGRLREELSR